MPVERNPQFPKTGLRNNHHSAGFELRCSVQTLDGKWTMVSRIHFVGTRRLSSSRPSWTRILSIAGFDFASSSITIKSRLADHWGLNEN